MPISIAIPSSALINEKDEKIKTYKVGLIARAAAIFRVEEILIYRDPVLDESDFIADILKYLETPQYLRKQLIPIKKTLRYAGVLPPLRIPSHKPKHLKIGEVREGVVKKVGPDGTAWVDIGVSALALLRGKASRGARVTVRVCSTKPLVVEEAKPREYWGYRVSIVELEELLKRNDLVITSRKCSTASIGEISALDDNITLVFGSPEKGVFEIAERLGLEIDAKCWNFIPLQGVETVRLEEAIFATLAIINFVKRS
jgi:predicted SPOUT superfamily RNA methylase MTH1